MNEQHDGGDARPGGNELGTREVLVTHEPVELYKVLKFEGLANSGGEAKGFIDEGLVQVNGEVETRRRRKLVDGDTIEFAGSTLRVRLGPPA